MLRQQEQQPDGKPNLSLADFIAPRDSGLQDYIGAFAITGGLGAEDLAGAFERDLDDYHAIMVKALADRLAEASAEWLHARARARLGLRRRRAAVRRRPDRRALSRHPPGVRLSRLPGSQRKIQIVRSAAGGAGRDLTDRERAMAPAASVSGLYFAHPQARYFTVGRIGRDQVESYAAPQGLASGRAWSRHGRAAGVAGPTWGIRLI